MTSHSDFEPECSCCCRDCRKGNHYQCTAIQPCIIAATCEDCDNSPCVCGGLDLAELELEDVGPAVELATWWDGSTSEFPTYPKEAL